MDFEQSYISKPGRIWNLSPFDIDELDVIKKRDPSFVIHVREEDETDIAQRSDKFKYQFGIGKSDTTQKMFKVSDQAVLDNIVGWEGLTQGGVPVECTNENKLKFAKAKLFLPTRGDKGEGAWVTFWGLTMEALDREQQAVLKNAPSSSRGTSGSE